MKLIFNGDEGGHEGNGDCLVNRENFVAVSFFWCKMEDNGGKCVDCSSPRFMAELKLASNGTVPIGLFILVYLYTIQ